MICWKSVISTQWIWLTLYKLQHLVFLTIPCNSLLYLLSGPHFCIHKCPRIGDIYCGHRGLLEVLGWRRVAGRAGGGFPSSSPDSNSPWETGSASETSTPSRSCLDTVSICSLNSFLLPSHSSPILSGLSYCQFVFIKITISARHWEISETTNLVLMKRRH